jgi:hypothetical protein
MFCLIKSKLNKLFEQNLMGPTGGNDGDDIVVQRVGELENQ